jgi:hypothetical protein
VTIWKYANVTMKDKGSFQENKNSSLNIDGDYEPINNATIKRLLRRTLHRSELK